MGFISISGSRLLDFSPMRLGTAKRQGNRTKSPADPNLTCSLQALEKEKTGRFGGARPLVERGIVIGGRGQYPQALCD